MYPIAVYEERFLGWLNPLRTVQNQNELDSIGCSSTDLRSKTLYLHPICTQLHHLCHTTLKEFESSILAVNQNILAPLAPEGQHKETNFEMASSNSLNFRWLAKTYNCFQKIRVLQRCTHGLQSLKSVDRTSLAHPGPNKSSEKWFFHMKDLLAFDNQARKDWKLQQLYSCPVHLKRRTTRQNSFLEPPVWYQCSSSLQARLFCSLRMQSRPM